MHGTGKGLHLGAQGSLCRLLHGFAILARQVLAELLFQMILLNEAPSQSRGTQQEPLVCSKESNTSDGLSIPQLKGSHNRESIRPRAHLNSSGE